MVKFIIIFIVLNLYSSAFSSSKEKIISKIKITNNFSFDFIQNIDGKNENI